MVMFFHRKQKYVVHLPVDQVQYRLKFLTNRRFDDYSIDIIGRLSHDGRFNLTNKWSMVNTNRVENRAAYMKGWVLPKDSNTLIEMSIRPNKVLVICFYAVLAIIGIELLNLENYFRFPRQLKIGLLLLADFFLLFAIFMSTNRLKKRFERLMQLN